MSRKKTRTCPACGLAFRKGARVLRLMPAGPVRQTVCKSCAALAVPVLASDSPSRCEQCGKNLARFCRGCVASLLEATPKRAAQAAAELEAADEAPS